MRILILIHSLRRGGAERVVLELSLSLQKKGHVVEILSWVDLDDFNDPEYSLVKRSNLISQKKYRWIWSIPSTSKILNEKITQFTPDLIHIHTPNVSWLAAWKCSKIPYLVVFHGYGELSRPRTFKFNIIKLIFRFAYKRLNANFSVVSESMLSYASNFVKQNESEIFCIPNGVDLNKFSFDINKKCNTDSPIISMIGTLCANKGQELGISAFKILLQTYPFAKLKIIGDGPDWLKLKKQVDDLKINENVDFLGNRNDIPKLIANSDIIWQLSESEAMPMVVLEAMSSGIPVIGFNVRGVQDLIVHNITGYLTQYGNIIEVSDYTIKLLKNEKVYSDFSFASRMRLEENYTIKNMIENYENVHKLIIKKNAK